MKIEECYGNDAEKDLIDRIVERKNYLNSTTQKFNLIDVTNDKGIEQLVKMHSELIDLYIANK